MKVSVVCALPERQTVHELEVAAGSTVAAALEQSGLQDEFPDLDLASAPVGIYGIEVARSRVLQAGDRIEIYRALRADPKEARRKRVRKS